MGSTGPCPPQCCHCTRAPCAALSHVPSVLSHQRLLPAPSWAEPRCPPHRTPTGCQSSAQPLPFPIPHLQQCLLLLEGLVADGVWGELHPDGLRLLQPRQELGVSLGELREQGLGVLQLHGAGPAAHEELLRTLPQRLHRGLQRHTACWVPAASTGTRHGRPRPPVPPGMAPLRPLTCRRCCRGSGQDRSSGSAMPSSRSASPRWCRISAESSCKTQAGGCRMAALRGCTARPRHTAPRCWLSPCPAPTTLCGGTAASPQPRGWHEQGARWP